MLKRFGVQIHKILKGINIFLALITAFLFAGSFVAGKHATYDLGPFTITTQSRTNLHCIWDADALLQKLTVH